MEASTLTEETLGQAVFWLTKAKHHGGEAAQNSEGILHEIVLAKDSAARQAQQQAQQKREAARQNAAAARFFSKIAGRSGARPQQIC